MTESWFQDWLKQAQNPLVLYGGGALLATGCYLIWRISRRIVWIGFFVLFTLVGFGLASAISFATLGQLAPMPFLYTSAIGFAAFASAVRSKVMKVVGAAIVLITCQTMGSYWVKTFRAEPPVKPHRPVTKPAKTKP